MMLHPARGTPHIHRVEQMEGAAKPVSAAPAATLVLLLRFSIGLVPARIRRPRPYAGVAAVAAPCAA